MRVYAGAILGCTVILFLFSLQGLVNNTGIDWFMPWPPQALHAVAKSFLGKSSLLQGPCGGLIKKFVTFLNFDPADSFTIDFRWQRITLCCYCVLGLYFALVQRDQESVRHGLLPNVAP